MCLEIGGILNLQLEEGRDRTLWTRLVDNPNLGQEGGRSRGRGRDKCTERTIVPTETKIGTVRK